MPTQNPLNALFSVNPFASNPSNLYSSVGGYTPNITNYSTPPGIMNMIKQVMLSYLQPYQQKVAPMGMFQSDFEHILRETSRRTANENRYQGISPAAFITIDRMTKGIGIGSTMPYMIDKSGQTTQFGKIVGDLYQNVLGFGASPYSQMGSIQNTVRDAMKGIIFDPGSVSRYGSGMSTYQAKTVVEDLMKGTYSDTLLSKKRGVFNAEDMTEILRMGRDYDVFKGTSVRDISKKTLAFSDLVQQSMGTFQTSSKEDAIRSLLEITGGEVSLQDTSKLKGLMDKVKNLSESANVSVQLMKQILERSAELQKSLGGVADTGTTTALSAMQSLRFIDSSAFMKGGISTRRPGEPTMNIRARMLAFNDYNQQLVASEDIRANYSFQAFAENRPGILNKDEMEQIKSATEGTGFLNNAQKTKFKNMIADAYRRKFPGMTQNDAILMANTALNNVGDQASQLAAENLSKVRMGVTDKVLDVIGVETPELKNAIEKIKAGEGSTLDAAILGTIQDRHHKIAVEMKLRSGMESKAAQEISTVEFNAAINRKQIKELERLQQKKDAASNLEKLYGERTRTTSTIAERFTKALTSPSSSVVDIIKSFLPEYENSLGITGQSLSPNIKKALPSFVLGKRGKEAFRAARLIYGTNLYEPERISEMLSLDISKIPTKADVPEGLRVKLQDALKSGRRIDLYEVMKEGENIYKGLATLRTLSPESYKGVMKTIKDVKRAGITPDSLTRLSLTGKSPEEFNKIEEVQNLAKELSVTKFDSIEQMKSLVASSRDKELIDKVRMWTGKYLTPEDFKTDKTVLEFAKKIGSKGFTDYSDMQKQIEESKNEAVIKEFDIHKMGLVNPLLEKTYKSLENAKSQIRKEEAIYKRDSRLKLLGRLLDPGTARGLEEQAKSYKIKGETPDISMFIENPRFAPLVKAYGVSSAIGTILGEDLKSEEQVVGIIKALSDKDIDTKQVISTKQLLEIREPSSGVSDKARSIMKKLEKTPENLQAMVNLLGESGMSSMQNKLFTKKIAADLQINEASTFRKEDYESLRYLAAQNISEKYAKEGGAGEVLKRLTKDKETGELIAKLKDVLFSEPVPVKFK